MKSIATIGLLIIANIFMTIAWYGHLKFNEIPQFNKLSLIMIIFISWGLAFFEYIFQVPANKFGYINNGGTFSLVELKVIQEVITLTIFTVFTLLFFKEEAIHWNHIAGFACLVLAVYFIFNKF
ncbi:MAG: DMT family protein [Candidatus Kapaibacterium sp.]|jgi:uncharacterized protein (DUF486 family)|nr:DMT family protein [Candidatus Kapabacteria bacterium]